MNNVWGNISQYEDIAWHWPIALYLFLAGLSAGSLMIALIIKWLTAKRKDGSNKSLFLDAVVEAGAIIAPLTISIGLLLLIIDLGKPFSFYLLLLEYNMTSVMSIGVIFLLIYSPLAFIFAFLTFSDVIKKIPILSLFSSIVDFVKNNSFLTKIIEYSAFTMAIGVAGYTGFLLSVNLSFPLWNTPILPLLFLVSALSSGVAINIIIALLFFKDDIHKDIIKYLLVLDLRIITLEAPLIVMLFIGVILSGGNGANVVQEALTNGLWAKVFWLGIVGVGFLVPVVISFSALKNHSYRVGFILLNAFSILFGVLMLRFYVVYAGQMFY